MSAVLEPDDGRSLIEAALDAVEGDAERIRFLIRQNDVLRAANVGLAKVCDFAASRFHELGHHIEGDFVEREASPF